MALPLRQVAARQPAASRSRTGARTGAGARQERRTSAALARRSALAPGTVAGSNASGGRTLGGLSQVGPAQLPVPGRGQARLEQARPSLDGRLGQHPNLTHPNPMLLVVK